MKPISKLIMVAICILFWTTAPAQWINSITVQPATPNITDTITVYVDCSFPSGNCDDHTQLISTSGTDIFASALHCLGALSIICNYTDTFKINPLPIGNYTFHFQVDAGAAPGPCTPGIVAGPTDSTTFIVTPASDVSEINLASKLIIFPNPLHDKIKITGLKPTDFPVKAELISIEGKIIISTQLKHSDDFILLNTIPTSFYTLNLLTASHKNYNIKIVKN